MAQVIDVVWQLPAILGIAVIAAFYLNAIIELWRGDYGRLFKVVWTLIIMSAPFLGAFLYYMFVSRAWREIIS